MSEEITDKYELRQHDPKMFDHVIDVIIYTYGLEEGEDLIVHEQTLRDRLPAHHRLKGKDMKVPIIFDNDIPF